MAQTPDDRPLSECHDAPAAGREVGVAASVPASDEWTGCTGKCAQCPYRAPCEAGLPIAPGR